uniref:Uncharacterized protein n=1 Tax=Arundo donax TaxID=35708 RepID=A0A0A9F4A5_ARUDO
MVSVQCFGTRTARVEL